MTFLSLIVAFVSSGLGTLFASFILETFFFHRLAKANPGLSPWNRELNALSLILAAFIGGLIAVRLAQSSALLSVALPDKLRGMLTHGDEARSPLPLLSAAAGVIALLWLLRHIVAANPLTVGWRGYLMNAASAAAGGSLLVAGRTRRAACATLLAALIVGFGTARYDSYAFDVAIPSDRALLRGAMLVPGRRADATHPAVLLVPDFGCQDRDETWGVNQPFREFAEHLMRSGYVTLRYDKRGCGKSSGEFTKLGLEDFAQDVVAAGTLLARREEVRGQPVLAVGHGTGGQAITIAANAFPHLFSGLALLATPASPISKRLRAQQRYKLETQGPERSGGQGPERSGGQGPERSGGQGATADELEARLAAVDDWIEGVQSRRYLNYGDYFGVRGLSEDLQDEQRTAPVPPTWLRQALAHDQPAILAGLSQPILILAGEADWRVPPAEAELMADALQAAGRSDWNLHLLPRVNHNLVLVESMEAGFHLEQTSDYENKRRPVAPEVLKILTDWLNSLTPSPPSPPSLPSPERSVGERSVGEQNGRPSPVQGKTEEYESLDRRHRPRV